jgi:hypothetical protein
MAPTSKPAKPTPPWKIAMIPLLGLGLLFVLWPSSSEPSADSAAATVTPEASAPAVTASPPVQEKASAPANSGLPKKWPVMELASILQHDPFAQPTALDKVAAGVVPSSSSDPEQPPAEAEPVESPEHQKRVAEWLVALKQKQVSAVFVSPRGASALVDSKVVREGDVLEEGIRVVAISAAGIVVRIEETH